MKSLPILVTGAAGFIGSKVSELLLEQGVKVVGIDNLNDAYDVRLKQWRLDCLLEKPGFVFHKTDIRDRDRLKEIFERGAGEGTHDGTFEAVINLAARAGVPQSVENPWVYFETNVTGTLNLLELCREFGVQKFVQASTSSLYSGVRERPFREDANTDTPLSPYAASKKAAEVLCYTYHSLYNIDVTVLRFFTVYGPAGRPEMSLFRFVQWIMEGRPVIVYGDGSQERDFTYVDDIAKGTIAGLRPLGYEVINLGSDRPVRLIDAIHRIEKLTGQSAKIEYNAFQPTDIRATWADIARAREILGWEPQVQYEEGLAATVNWYLQNRVWVSGIVTL